jgi:hypothetical protein
MDVAVATTVEHQFFWVQNTGNANDEMMRLAELSELIANGWKIVGGPAISTPAMHKVLLLQRITGR